MSNFIQDLTRELEAKPVNKNSFYRRFKEETLTDEQLKRFGGQYFWFCQNFIPLLAGLIYNTPLQEEDIRLELVKTLYSELGYGKKENVHLNLLRRFTTALGFSEGDLQNIEPIPEVENYIRQLEEFFVRSDFRTALGSEFGVEITAALEFTYLFPGIQKYPQFSRQDIYFFEFHLAEEQLHGDWLTEAVSRMARTEDAEELIKEGALKAADLWGSFWEGMERYVFVE